MASNLMIAGATLDSDDGIGVEPRSPVTALEHIWHDVSNSSTY